MQCTWKIASMIALIALALSPRGAWAQEGEPEEPAWYFNAEFDLGSISMRSFVLLGD